MVSLHTDASEGNSSRTTGIAFKNSTSMALDPRPTSKRASATYSSKPEAHYVFNIAVAVGLYWLVRVPMTKKAQ